MASLKIKKPQPIQLSILLAIIALLVAIYVYAYMGNFARYIADDYCTAGDLRTFGFFQAIINRYLTWDGRYSFSFFNFLFDLFGAKFPSILPAISITLWLASSFYFFKQIAKRFFTESSNLLILLISTLFAFTVIYTVPQVAENFYWMTGITTYLFPVIFELVLLGLVIKILPELSEKPLAKKILWLALFFVLSFICSGFSEVSTALHVTIFGILFIIEIVKKIVNKTAWHQIIFIGIVFLGAVLGFVIMAIAPGNSVRMTSLTPGLVQPGIIELVRNSSLRSSKYLFKWLSDFSAIIWPVSFLLIFIGAFFPSLSSIRSNNHQMIGKKLILWVLFFMILLVVVSFVPSTWVGYAVPAPRILLLTTSVLSWAVVSCSFLLGILLRVTFNIGETKSSLPNMALIVLNTYFMITIPLSFAWIYFESNVLTQINYGLKWDQVNAQIIDDINKGQEFIVTDNIAYSLMDLERITDDPAYWTNQCAATYYQVKEIISR